MIARHSKPRLSFWFVLGSVLARGEISMIPTPSRYLLIIEWCSVSSFSELRRWRRRGHGSQSVFPAERRRRLFPIQSDPFI
jgi:hypothetical protein